MNHRTKLLLLAMIFFGPPLVAYYLFWFAPLHRYSNYGELLPVSAVPQSPLIGVGGALVSPQVWAGKWVLVVAGNATCDERCRNSLVLIRQLRLTQGREMGRIKRLWLVRNDISKVDNRLLESHPDLIVASMSTEWARVLGTEVPFERHVFLVDPRGNLMMRFPENPEPKRMMKDLQRLLYANKAA